MVDCIRGVANDRIFFMMVDSVLRDFAKQKFGNSETQNIYILGGGTLTFAFLFVVIKRKESPAQRARANRFFCAF